MKIINLFIIFALLFFSCKSLIISKTDFDKIEPIKISSKYQKGRTEFTKEENEMFDKITKVINLPVFQERYKILPACYITLLDKSRNPLVGLTVKSDGVKIWVEKGYDTSIEPFAAIGLTDENIDKMSKIFSDGDISEEDDFLINNLFIMTCFENIFNSKEVRYLSMIKKIIVPTPAFMTLENPTKAKLPPDEDWTQLMIYEENGHYKIKKGQTGIPKISYSIKSQTLWQNFLKFWAIFSENDFDKKMDKIDELQKQLISLGKIK